MNRGISPLYEMRLSTFQKNLTPSPIIHELLKHQSRYHHRVLTAYKIRKNAPPFLEKGAYRKRTVNNHFTKDITFGDTIVYVRIMLRQLMQVFG